MSELNYKDTLNLPVTDFPMKANLAQREPDILKHWERLCLYQKLQQEWRDRPKFILNDGPPYANGAIHIGHAVNKILKDIIIKSKVLSGYQAPYVPGWDCHGLPIEHQVEKKMGKAGYAIDSKTFRHHCREFATQQIELQKEAFIRLGILGDWARPYLTMDYIYEANTIRSLATIIQNGHLQRGDKPVHWCIDCRSALAEAEIEYIDKTSPAIDVRFEVSAKEKALTPFGNITGQGPLSVVIWTTTPWTLPANEAVVVHPDYDYALVQTDTECLILAKELVSPCMARFQITEFSILATCQGKALENLLLQHPFYKRTVPVILGDHVTLEAGTGCVHTAPAHGAEDHVVGQKYHLPIDNPVNSKGCFTEDTPLFAGQFVFKANATIIETLKENGKLLYQETIQHSYPHCWRHKTPTIFRATPQWFISMDKKHLRENALKAIRSVSWVPEWGQARIENMIATRPDWCISRQRNWGVPLSLFIHKETGDLHPRSVELMEAVAKRVEKEGIDAWHDLKPEELLGSDAQQYEKSLDILDVWFDSGVAHFCVLDKHKELQFPADLYLEGSDQHRGWFQSSLLTSIAMKDKAPYKTVLTHGFTVDAKGHKMSKSQGNAIAPDEVVSSFGADVLRLWIAATDYKNEIVVSQDILKQTADIYRRIRNTARFLLANLAGFDFTKDEVPLEKLLVLDRWMIEKANQLQTEITQCYADFQFHVVYQKIHHFCAIDLGSFYLDIIKDRQYTGQKDGLPRRSAQTTMYYLTEALVRWIAPILSFTAEEIWLHLPKREESVFLSTWYELPSVPSHTMGHTFWHTVMEVRDCVNKALETARNNKQIGSSLEANVTLYCDKMLQQTLSQLEDELRFVLITSYATLKPLSEKPIHAEATDKENLWLVIEPLTYAKCVRCWHRRESVNTNAKHPDICDRCVDNITGQGEKRLYA